MKTRLIFYAFFKFIRKQTRDGKDALPMVTLSQFANSIWQLRKKYTASLPSW